MFKLLVVEPGIELEFASHFIAPVIHHQTLEVLNLVAVTAGDPRGALELVKDLEPGVFCNWKNGLHYFLNGPAQELSSGLAGVWYTAMYKADEVPSPHFFRPLIDSEGGGWLQGPTPGARFVRASTFEIALNGLVPDRHMDR